MLQNAFLGNLRTLISKILGKHTVPPNPLEGPRKFFLGTVWPIEFFPSFDIPLNKILTAAEDMYSTQQFYPQVSHAILGEVCCKCLDRFSI